MNLTADSFRPLFAVGDHMSSKIRVLHCESRSHCWRGVRCMHLKTSTAQQNGGTHTNAPRIVLQVGRGEAHRLRKRSGYTVVRHCMATLTVRTDESFSRLASVSTD